MEANLLDRNFTMEGLGEVWVSDITYILSERGWLYLTTVMDLGDRQILGWSLSEGMSAEETSRLLSRLSYDEITERI